MKPVEVVIRISSAKMWLECRGNEIHLSTIGQITSVHSCTEGTNKVLGQNIAHPSTNAPSIYLLNAVKASLVKFPPPA